MGGGAEAQPGSSQLGQAAGFAFPGFGQPLKEVGNGDPWNCCYWELQLGQCKELGAINKIVIGNEGFGS